METVLQPLDARSPYVAVASAAADAVPVASAVGDAVAGLDSASAAADAVPVASVVGDAAAGPDTDIVPIVAEHHDPVRHMYSNSWAVRLRLPMDEKHHDRSAMHLPVVVASGLAVSW